MSKNKHPFIPNQPSSPLLQVAKSYSGPIPDPASLAKYAQIDATLVNRIVEMAEKQSAHRMEMEKIVIRSRERQSVMGQIFAFVLALGLIVAALIIDDHIISRIIFGVTLLGIVSLFLTGKFAKRKAVKNNTIDKS
jgi:uncharacterized membrane protein